jgi:tRNA(Arg) A34 adenosine deaminase TadA
MPRFAARLECIRRWHGRRKIHAPRAIELSAHALDAPGARPYGAVVVMDGKVVGEGLNQSAKNFDPTSHGEVEAIRDACRNLKTTDLSGADLYTSCEPCSVCVATMLMAGISRMYYGGSLEQSGRIVPPPKMPPPAIIVREQVGKAGRRAQHAAGRGEARRRGGRRVGSVGEETEVKGKRRRGLSAFPPPLAGEG